MSFRELDILAVQQATDIVRLVGEQVALKPAGREFKGLCPFHEDHNPSMQVSPAKQIYKCFSCGAGGNVFNFVMNYHKMNFPEAVKYLAERAGIKLVEEGRGPGAKGQGEEEGPTDRKLIADANARALSFFRTLLAHAEHGKLARKYIEDRHISPDMVEQFQLGYAPDRWDGLALTIAKNNWNTRSFELAGLITQRDRDRAPQASSLTPQASSHYDRLRHRLIFPICDALGRPIAFGGRKLREEDEPKYLNSPETPLFNKSATVYGLHLAKKAIIDARTAVIVEGYTDVIACHQAGVRNVVATLGTALTTQHITELRRYCDKVVLIFDADEAGIKASDRAVEVFLTESMDVNIAVLPEEMDPAELFETPTGLERWNDSIKNAVDALEYQLQRLRARFEAADTLTGKQNIAESYLRGVAQLGLQRVSLIRRGMVVQRISELLHISEAQTADALKRLAPVARSTAALAATPPDPNMSDKPGKTAENSLDTIAVTDDPHKMSALRVAERQVIGGLLRQPERFHQTLSDGRTLDEAVTPDLMLTTPERRLYEMIYQRLCDGQPLTLGQLLAELSAAGDQALSDLATLAESEAEAFTAASSSSSSSPSPNSAAAGDTDIVASAAGVILQYHRERAYQSARRDLTHSDQAQVQSLADHLRNNPSPVRIARVPGRNVSPKGST